MPTLVLSSSKHPGKTLKIILILKCILIQRYIFINVLLCYINQLMHMYLFCVPFFSNFLHLIKVFSINFNYRSWFCFVFCIWIKVHTFWEGHQKAFQLIWILLSKHKIILEILPYFCSLLRIDELYFCLEKRLKFTKFSIKDKRNEKQIWLKFIYSEKATKFFKISTLLLSYVVPVKS